VQSCKKIKGMTEHFSRVSVCDGSVFSIDFWLFSATSSYTYRYRETKETQNCDGNDGHESTFKQYNTNKTKQKTCELPLIK
jgi:hypothetical protein